MTRYQSKENGLIVEGPAGACNDALCEIMPAPPMILTFVAGYAEDAEAGYIGLVAGQPPEGFPPAPENTGEVVSGLPAGAFVQAATYVIEGEAAETGVILAADVLADATEVSIKLYEGTTFLFESPTQKMPSPPMPPDVIAWVTFIGDASVVFQEGHTYTLVVSYK